ncbi:MAG: hypothetical protein IPG79_01695 [Saprospiraceae bacterium]|nr:hypothetical protein [Saprospiraceae bacterium]
MYVDSLLSEQIQISLNEDVNFPLKPEKPVSKNPVIINGFYKPETIFKDTVLVQVKNHNNIAEEKSQMKKQNLYGCIRLPVLQ